jgi:uncharacterized protein involved in exopolysaccharide biosynthesis
VGSSPRSPLSVWRLCLLAVLGGLIGLVLALAMPWPHGPSHSCPANGPACFYPANLDGQRQLWAAIGMLVGLLIAIAAASVASRRRPNHS